MSNPTIKEIVAQYLKANGYDGLYSVDGECSCAIEDLAPCDEVSDECIVGYKNTCDDEDGGQCYACIDWGWHIQADNPRGQGTRVEDLKPGEDWAAKHCDPHVEGCRCRACYTVTEPDTSERAYAELQERNAHLDSVATQLERNYDALQERYNKMCEAHDRAESERLTAIGHQMQAERLHSEAEAQIECRNELRAEVARLKRIEAAALANLKQGHFDEDRNWMLEAILAGVGPDGEVKP